MKRISKIWKRRRITVFLDKRQRFAIQTLILTAGILATQLIWEDYRFVMVGILSLLSYALTSWSLTEDVTGIEWLILFILPVFYTASLSLFYFLLPGRWLTRVVITVVFAVGMYAILLVENIHNVAASRSIQLVRAARSVGFLLTLIVVFLCSNIVYSFRLSGIFNMLILSIITFILAIQSVWSVKLEQKIESYLLIYSLVVAVAIGELAMALSFWPIENASYSLLITAGFYTMISLIQQHLTGRLFKDSVREYAVVFVFTLILTFLTTHWG
jgi:hypothetical protein